MNDRKHLFILNFVISYNDQVKMRAIIFFQPMLQYLRFDVGKTIL